MFPEKLPSPLVPALILILPNQPIFPFLVTILITPPASDAYCGGGFVIISIFSFDEHYYKAFTGGVKKEKKSNLIVPKQGLITPDKG